MANVNAPYGLIPVRYQGGAAYTGAANPYFATGATGAIYVGDPVVLAGSANTSAFGDYGPGMLATVTVALDGDGDVKLGVCVAVLAANNASVPYRENSTDRIIMVADEPNLIFRGQCNAASTAWAATDVGSYASMLVGTGSTVTGKSAWTLDTTDVPDPADPSNELLIMNLSRIPNNAIGAYAQWDVMINNHQLANVADGGRFTGV